METIKTRTSSGSNGMSSISKSYGTRNNSSRKGMESLQLMQLLEEELKEIYWTENALIKLIPNCLGTVMVFAIVWTFLEQF